MNQTSYRVLYQFNQHPREHQIELDTSDLDTPHLSNSVAALHLLQLHFGDAENSLIMPSADAAPEQVVRQAMLLGISDIEVETPL